MELSAQVRLVARNRHASSAGTRAPDASFSDLTLRLFKQSTDDLHNFILHLADLDKNEVLDYMVYT